MTRPRQGSAALPPEPYLPEATPAERKKPARQRCYEAMKADMLAGVSRYYAEHSDRLGDERSGDAIAWSTRGIDRILRILDGYAISDLDNRAQAPQKDAAP